MEKYEDSMNAEIDNDFGAILMICILFAYAAATVILLTVTMVLFLIKGI